jgi:uncharacterized membrane protein (UPF0127 family)
MNKEKISGLGKKFNISKIPKLKEVKTIGQEARGLTFRSKKNARALLFEFSPPVRLSIHSLFVFFPFVAVWLNQKDEVIQKKVVRPWKIRIKPTKSFSKLVEIPINKFYRREIGDLLKLN